MDDDNVSIAVDSMKVDDDGDPGYVLSIANNTDGKVYAFSDVGWTVNGAAADPVLMTTVDAGETVEAFLWFDRAETGLSSLKDLKDVEGAIIIQAFGSSAVIGTYPFQM